MKNTATMLFLLMALAQPARADQCVDRTVKLSKPLFPKSLEQLQIIQKERFCVIHIAFSINMDGRAENIDHMAEKPICESFNVNAIRAIRGSQFSGGDYVQSCFIRLTFALEGGEMVWRYDAE